ncbi:hypothetical protein AX16_003078 [Volvariella volvacea WC 439]|nr:hypothetical protein AX16_003078 [Volvariella volvacea WC 439]
MASNEEQLFWKGHLLNTQRTTSQANSTLIEDVHTCCYTPISASSLPPSPLVTLPVELLCKIFWHSVRDRFYDETYNFLVKPAEPTKMAQICRYWRVVALSDPTLWASLSVRLINHSSVQRARLWLIRTGSSCPLSLGFGGLYDSDPKAMDNLMSLYISHRRRWSKVYFQFPPTGINSLQLLARLPHGAAPQLNVAMLECRGCPVEMMQQAWDTFGSSPNFNVTRLRGLTRGFMPILPWSQLDQASFANIGAQAIVDILPHCQRLKDLQIGCPFRDGFPSVSTPITLPSLRKLEFYVPGASMPFLSCLTAPHLRELLIIQPEGGNLDPNPAAFHDFLARSRCTLEFFKFSDFGIDEETFVQSISSPLLSSVKSAILSGRLSNYAIQALTLPLVSADANGGTGILPLLQFLELRNCQGLESGMIEQMLLSRAWTGRQYLKAIELVVEKSYTLDQTIINAMKSLHITRRYL